MSEVYPRPNALMNQRKGESQTESYCLLQETIEDDGTERSAYGIVTPSGIRISDVSDCQERLNVFIMDLNAGQADEIHIYELVDDFVNEAAML